MTWNIRKHRRGTECTEHLYPRLVSWESSHRRQWDTICSPHPCGTVQYVLFQIQGRWIIFLFFLLQKSFPCDSILSDLPPLEHQWGISGHLKKAHWEREISSMCCSRSTGADPWTDFLSWFPRHNRCLFTCDQAFRQSTAGGGGRTSWMSNETILCDLERHWQHDVLFNIWKKPSYTDGF